MLFQSALSENLFGGELGQELVIVDLAIKLLIIALNERLQLFVWHIEAVLREELTKVIFVDEAIVAIVDQFKRLKG